MEEQKDQQYNTFTKTKTIRFTSTEIWETIQSDWRNAELLFRVGLEFGTRANEAFTLSAFPPETTAKKTAKGFVQDAKGTVHTGIVKLAKNKVVDKLRLVATIATWKTQKLEAGALTVLEFINNQNTEVIWKRCQEVRKKYNYDEDQKQTHTLIGDDDEYMGIQRIGLHPNRNTPNPTQEQNRSRLYAVLKHCYASKEGGNKDWNDTISGAYFFTHPAHCIRHVMAQQYSFQTNQDWDWIAQRGHWKTIGVLKDSYAGIDDTINLKKNMIYGDLGFNDNSMDITEAEKQLFQSPEYVLLTMSEHEQNLLNSTYRKDEPVNAYWIFLIYKQHNLEWEKSLPPNVLKFAKEFHHDQVQVDTFNAQFKEQIEKGSIQKVEFVEKPIEEKDKEAEKANNEEAEKAKKDMDDLE